MSAPSANHGSFLSSVLVQPSEALENNGKLPLNIAVIGAGAFGTAMAHVAAQCGHRVKVYARNAEVVNSINESHFNPHYLSEFVLHNNISATSSVPDVLSAVAFAIIAIPTQLVCTIIVMTCSDCPLIMN